MAGSAKDRRKRCRRKAVPMSLFGIVLIFLVFHCSGAHAFFIDLEALGFPTTKSEDSEGSGSEDGVTARSSFPQISEDDRRMVEVESQSDPHKSVKITLSELKQLVLGTVKDLTPQIPPINIKINTNRDRPTVKTESSSKGKKVKITDSMLQAYMKSRNPFADSEEDLEKYLPKTPGGTSVVLPPYDDDGLGEHYTKSNELSGSDKVKSTVASSDDEDENGWYSAAKAVLRGPVHVVSSYSKKLNRWRSGGKTKASPYKPIQDITYDHDPPPEKYRRRKLKRRRRPGFRRRFQGQRRRGHPPNRRQRLPQYQNDDYGEGAAQYSYGASSTPYSDGYYDDAWGRMDHLTEFDSTMPFDDTPSNMMPPSQTY